MDQLHENCEIEWLIDRRESSLLALMYKRAQNVNFTVRPPRELRSSNKIKLKVNRPHCEVYRKSPLFRGAMLWDELESTQQHKLTRTMFMNSL